MWFSEVEAGGSDGDKGAGDGIDSYFNDVKEGLDHDPALAPDLRVDVAERSDVLLCCLSRKSRKIMYRFMSHHPHAQHANMPSIEDVYSNDQDWYPGSTHFLLPLPSSDDSSQSVSAQNQAKLPTKQYTTKHRTCKLHSRPSSNPLLIVTRMTSEAMVISSRTNLRIELCWPVNDGRKNMMRKFMQGRRDELLKWANSQSQVSGPSFPFCSFFLSCLHSLLNPTPLIYLRTSSLT